MQFCLDKHGEWVVVSANDDDKEEDEEDAFFGAKNEQQVKKIAKTLADATTWLDMLNDTQRNIMFQRAVENCIGKTNSQKNELTVFDVGSGTGLLSLFAARAKTLSEKTFVKIYSCEMYLPIFLVGELVVRENRRVKKIPVTSSIHMFHKRSEDVDAIRKNELDILISELLDSALLGEGWLLVLRNIFERELLRKNHFSIVPNSAKIYLQLLDAGSSVLDAKDRRTGLYGEAITSDGFSRLDVQCHFDSLERRGKIKAISEHIEVFDIDFTSNNDWGRTKVVSCSSSTLRLDMSDHEINAVAMFWDVDLDGTGVHRLNTFPCAGGNNHGFRRHWRQIIAPLEYAISLSSIITTEKPIRIETRIADDYLALDAKVSCDEMIMKKKKEKWKETPMQAIKNPKPTHEEGKRWLCIALANISEFWFSRAPLGENLCGLDLTKANMLLCTKPVENISGCCYQSFKSDLLDELGHLSSTTEDEATMILWKSSVLFVTDDDENKKEEGNKKKFYIDVDAGRSITTNHVVFFFSDKSPGPDEWKRQRQVQVARMDRELTGQKFKIIASNFDAEEGECIRVLKY